MTTNPTEDETDTEPATRAKLLDLSLTQLLGGSMAAATAAALGSRLGVMGTIVGAAVGSVVTAVAASIYTTSMSRAREAVAAARAYSRGLDETPRPEWWRRPDTAATRRILVTTGAIFAIAAAFLTGLQLATGAPVTGTDLGSRSAAAGTTDRSSTGVDPAADQPVATTTSGPTVTGTPTPSVPLGAAPPDPAAPPSETNQGDSQTSEPATDSTGTASPAAPSPSPSTPAGQGATTLPAAP